MARMQNAESLISKKGMKAASSTARFCIKDPLLCIPARTSWVICSPSQQQLHATDPKPVTRESHMCNCRAVTLERGCIYLCVVFGQQYNFCNLLHTQIATCASMFKGMAVKKTYGFWMCSTVLSGK